MRKQGDSYTFMVLTRDLMTKEEAAEIAVIQANAIRDVWSVIGISTIVCLVAAISMIVLYRKRDITLKTGCLWMGCITAPCLAIVLCCARWLREPAEDGALFLLDIFHPFAIIFYVPIGAMGALIGLGFYVLIRILTRTTEAT